ncbi:MAG: hypothetical protein H8K10_00680 [Nitrospira sp.]|nr:hypothetical protein [Nitrospira sp.]
MDPILRRTVIIPLLLAAATQFACTMPPPPRTSYQDPITAIRLYVDEHAQSSHQHPADVSSEQIAKVLGGLRVIPRSGFIGSLITGQAQATPAFSSTEIQALAPRLSRALTEAKPDELVTFYRRFSDSSTGLAITSGGMFVQDGYLVVVLANNRTLPTDGMNQNMVTDFDPVDSPLVPISRTSFRVEFAHPSALAAPDKRPSWPYIDEGRILAIDLRRLSAESKSPSGPPAP